MKDVVASLLNWFALHKRDLPWRKDKNPYRLFVAESMLQQTRIAAVIPKYEAFMERFPSFADLASSSEEDVLKAWEGLGYYSRAKNLRKAAIQVEEEYGGSFPSSRKDIAKLKGVGPYTSASLASFCFGERCVCVDGNLIRVYARLLSFSLPRDDITLKEGAESFFLGYMDEADPGSINEALMELGETICLPKGRPLCEGCPLRKWCKGKDSPEQYPLPKSNTNKKKEEYTVLVFKKGTQVGFIKRDDKGLLSGMYGLPMIEGKKSLGDLRQNEEGKIIELGDFSFEFTHKIWEMRAFLIEEGTPLYPLIYAEKDKTKRDFAIPSAFNGILAKLSF